MRVRVPSAGPFLDRLKVGQQTLNLFMLVRIQLGDPFLLPLPLIGKRADFESANLGSSPRGASTTKDFIMIYKYTIFGKLHNTNRGISHTVSIPMGLSVEEVCTRLTAFCKAFNFVKLEIN